MPLTLDDCDSSFHLLDLLQDSDHLEVDDRGRVEVALEGYDYRWLRLMPRGSRRLAQDGRRRPRSGNLRDAVGWRSTCS
ncbi:MAG: hypothetical protein WAV00_17825 [Nocardioides sp.]